MGSSYGSKGAVYYRCIAKCSSRGPRANTGSYIEVRAVERLAAPLVLEKLREMREALATPAVRAQAPDFSEQRTKLRAKKARITDAFTDGAMSRDEHRARLAKVDEELLRLDAEEERQARPDRRPRREVLRELREIEQAWKRADGKKRRTIVNDLVERAYLLPNAPPVLVFRDAEDLVSEE